MDYALITGAAGLLGVEHAKALLDGGFGVVLTDIDREKLEEVGSQLTPFYGEKVKPIYMDVTNEESCKDVKAVLEKMGITISILVNNAAINPHFGDQAKFGRFENFSLEAWNQELEVGLTGAFIVTKTFYHHLRANKGKVINIASDLSVIAPDQNLYRQEGVSEEEQPVKPVTYSVIKHGIVGLTKYLASYLAKDGVCVNSLSPGGVFNAQPEPFLEKLNSKIPVGRMANVDEYHDALRFLASRNNNYMTGQNLIVDGGRTLI